MSSWGSPLLDPKKLPNEQFHIIDWIRKKLLVDVANLATCCHDDYDVLLEVLGTVGKCYVSNPVAKTLVWIENHDWQNCFCMSSWGSPLLDPKKLQNEQFYIIDWMREKLLVDVANLAPCCHDDYDVLLEVLGTLGKCYVSNPVAKTLVWIENHDWHNCFCMSSRGSPLLDPKMLQNEQFYIIDWIRKKLLVDVANLAPCCHDDYDVLLKVLGTLGKCYVSNPVAKTLVWIEHHDWHNCFCMSSRGSPLLDPKKLQNEQLYIIDWIRKKLLVDVANLAPCCHDDYDVLLEVLGTLGKCYVSNPVAKTLVWIENHDWHNCFCMSSWGSPLLDPKKLQNAQFYIIDWIRKKILVDVANLAPCCHDDYDVLLEVLGTLGKCYVSNPVAKTLVWIENHDWHNCFCMSSWGSPLLDPKKLQNEQFYIIDWIRKKLLVDVVNLAPCCHDDYDVLLEVLGTLGKCYVSNPVAKTLVWIENHDWHNCFCMSSWGSALLGPKKLQNKQFYIIDWIRKKLLVDVANLAPCCHDDYDVLLENWEPWANAMLAILLPKPWFGLKIMTGTTVFACLPGAHPYWTQKNFKTNCFT